VGFAVGDRVSKIDQVIDLLATPDRWCKGDCQEFRAGLGMMGAKEAVHAATQRTSHS
jgi:hypothetical protein